jgi:hypothetical protein
MLLKSYLRCLYRERRPPLVFYCCLNASYDFSAKLDAVLQSGNRSIAFGSTSDPEKDDKPRSVFFFFWARPFRHDCVQQPLSCKRRIGGYLQAEVNPIVCTTRLACDSWRYSLPTFFCLLVRLQSNLRLPLLVFVPGNYLVRCLFFCPAYSL